MFDLASIDNTVTKLAKASLTISIDLGDYDTVLSNTGNIKKVIFTSQ